MIRHITILLVCIFLTAANGWPIGFLFDTRIEYHVGISAQQSCASDFNGDGYMDLALTRGSPDSGRVYILINKSDGTFHDGASYWTGSGPQYLCAADLDSDGDEDLAVVNHGLSYSPDSTVSILLNNGDGTFAPSARFEAGSNPLGVCGADLDSDNDCDLIITNQHSRTVTVLSNDGSGGFSIDSVYSVGPNPISVCAADLNGDSIGDIAVTNGDTTNISVLINGGDGTFLPRVDYEVGPTSSAICACDFNDDGANDLAVGKYYSDRIAILINNGDGTFADTVDYIAGATFTGIVASDFDADGDYDLAASQDGPEAVAVLLNNGDGTFGQITSYTVNNEAYSVCAADFDNDGLIDIIATTHTPFISFLRNMGGGKFPQPPYYEFNASSIIASDLDNDGDYDLAGVGSDSVSIMPNNGNGTFAPSFSFSVDSFPTDVCASDLNGDGTTDLILEHGAIWPDTGHLSILIGKGDGTFQAPVEYFTGSTPFIMLANDFDNDGDNDLAVNGGPDSISVLQNNGDGTFQDPITYWIGNSPRCIVSDDLNGDGAVDLISIISVQAYNPGVISVLINNGDGTFMAPANCFEGSALKLVSSSDIDNDGHVDLVVGYYEVHKISILKNNGDGTFVIHGEYDDVAYEPYAISITDFDGDGDNDPAVLNWGTNNILVLLNDGNGTFPETIYYGTGRNPKSMFIADYDGDGDDDIASKCSQGVFIHLNQTIITDVGDGIDEQLLPRNFTLSQNYPNPFNPSTRIDYYIPKRNRVTISIYNLIGQKVAIIVDEVKPVGRHSIIWDGRDNRSKRVASGIYFYRLQVGDRAESKKMILLK
jgi:hypothetical protein